jgi:hypothetical protein
MEKPELQQRLQAADLGLEDADFAYHATDLYVVAKAGVIEWLRRNYEHFSNITTFVSPEGSGWNGAKRIEGPGIKIPVLCLDIPFAGHWPKAPGH